MCTHARQHPIVLLPTLTDGKMSRAALFLCSRGVCSDCFSFAFALVFAVPNVCVVCVCVCVSVSVLLPACCLCSVCGLHAADYIPCTLEHLF